MEGMILYADDYKNHPTAFPNFETTNTSYLRSSALLRDMGVKNHKFMLALHNKNLVGIDPHDPNLSPVQMMAIYQECYSNFWYFVREVVRVPGSSIEMPLPYLANRANLCLHWLYVQHIFTILTQIRQTGKSFGVAIPHLWQMHVRNRKSTIIGLTKDMSLRSSHLSLMKSLDEEFPIFIRQRQESDVANTEIINISRLSNKMVMFVPAKSPKQADRVGRGHVAGSAWVDEGPYVSNLQISLAAMFAATNKARQTAFLKKEAYCNVLTSTVGDLAEKEGEFYFKLTQNSAEFTEHMYDCVDREDLLAVINKQCRAIENVGGKKVPVRVYAEFNHRQMGIEDDQVATWIAEAAAEGADAEKDYLNKWKFGSTQTALSKEQKDTIDQSQAEPDVVSREPNSGYMVRWYIPEHEIEAALNHEVTTWGLDTSDASGGDAIGLVGRLPSTGQVIATMNINETFIPTFSVWIYRFMKKYPKTLLVPERRSSAASIIDQLLVFFIEDNVNPFRRIYNTIVQNHLEKKELFDLISKPYFCDSSVILANKKAFGFATSGSGETSRSELYGRTMTNALRLTGSTVFDKQLINQMSALIVDESGRVDHRAGMHDDLVIGWLLSFWVLTNGKNLDFYGIQHRNVLKNNNVNKADNDPERLYNLKLTEQIKGQIEAYTKMHSSYGNNAFLRSKIEHELKRLYNSLPEESKGSFIMDGIMFDIVEEKKLNRMKDY